MTTLLLPFGIRLRDGEIVSASDVPRGAACGCICPGCRHPLVARQGTEREWHFAHAKAADCADGYEKSVHELAKQRIKQERQLLLPAMDAQARDFDAFGLLVEEKLHVMDARLVPLDGCEASHPLGDVTPDLIGHLKGRRILVEIVVFHRLMPEKEARLVESSVPSFQIDLGVFQSRQATKDDLDRELFENSNNRRWIWHPKQEEAQKSVEARVSERLKEARVRWDAEQALLPRIATHVDWASPRVAEPLATPPASETAYPLQWRRWRAGLPRSESITSAANRLAERTCGSALEILRLTDTISSRGMLVDVTPVEVASKWAEALGIEQREVEQFLVDADYVL